MKINWPTALVLSVLVAAYVILDALDKTIPHWLMTVAAAMGTGVAAAMDRLFKGGPETPSEVASSDSDETPKPTTGNDPPEAA